MRKFVRTYSPFLVYFVCVALAYFLCFYLFPKYNAALAYLGFLIIYTYIAYCEAKRPSLRSKTAAFRF